MVSLQIELHFDIFELDVVLGHVSHQTEFAHAAESTCGKMNMDKTAKLAHEDTLVLNVGQLTFFGLVVGVGNVVTHERGFTGKCTFAGHLYAPFNSFVWRHHGADEYDNERMRYHHGIAQKSERILRKIQTISSDLLIFYVSTHVASHSVYGISSGNP